MATKKKLTILEKVQIIHEVENNPNMPEIEKEMMFTLCLLNVVIEKNILIVIKLRLFNVLILRNYFVFNVIVSLSIARIVKSWRDGYVTSMEIHTEF
jgi:hypothetical protein